MSRSEARQVPSRPTALLRMTTNTLRLRLQAGWASPHGPSGSSRLPRGVARPVSRRCSRRFISMTSAIVLCLDGTMETTPPPVQLHETEKKNMRKWSEVSGFSQAVAWLLTRIGMLLMICGLMIVFLGFVGTQVQPGPHDVGQSFLTCLVLFGLSGALLFLAWLCDRGALKDHS